MKTFYHHHTDLNFCLKKNSFTNKGKYIKYKIIGISLNSQESVEKNFCFHSLKNSREKIFLAHVSRVCMRKVCYTCELARNRLRLKLIEKDLFLSSHCISCDDLIDLKSQM